MTNKGNKFANKPSQTEREAPSLEIRVRELLSGYLIASGRDTLPDTLPAYPKDAAKWMIDYLFEGPTRPGGHREHAQRVLVLTRHFLTRGSDLRRRVVDLRKDGIFWRGETLQELINLDVEVGRCGMDQEAYRKESLKKSRKLVSAIESRSARMKATRVYQ